MKKSLQLIPLALAFTSAFGAIEPAPFAFDVKQLSGVWADSVDTEPACAMKNWHFRYEFSVDRKRLSIKFDREIDSGTAGKISQIDATVLSATARTITFRYDGEQRMNSLGKPVEWQLAMIAPGVYRWHATDWRPGQVNTVVGIQCSEN
ncbi:hypothetical protein [Aquabacterium sp.]|uniref:hypothetical protein n=1 Tax=Aquabacterium sp. TaxID=1872578 RepID=UPI0025C58F4C|nr:hypothetical protein [Aquabacterium sp.]